MTSPAVLADRATQHLSSDAAWFIVSQVKSDRVVYFTDDPEYHPPTEGDWYYVSPYQGSLPEGMTLRNCWGWRFRGMDFIDARDVSKVDTAQALLQHNKQALHKLLNDKIDIWRKPCQPPAALGSEIHRLRLQEAQEILGSPDQTQFDHLQLLPAAAAVRGLSLADMAQRTLDAHQRTQALLIESECLRDEIARAIDQTTAQTELMVVRERIMNEVVPRSAENEKITPAHTTPKQKNRLPSEEELEQEKLRLRVQLRLKVNQLRRPFTSDYLLDDAVMRFKLRVAQTVLASNGTSPEGQDTMLLVSHAAARGQSLKQAAHDVLAEMNLAGKALTESEQMKDALLSRIAEIQSFADIEQTSQIIKKLELPD